MRLAKKSTERRCLLSMIFIAQIKLTYPKKLTSEQKELLQQLQDSFENQEAKPHESIFESAFEKVKSWFKK